MKRILYVSTSSTVGGAEKTMFTLATLVDPKIAKVTGVVSLKTSGHYAQKLRKAGARTFSLDIKSRAGMGDLQKLAVIVHETKPDLVHAIMYQAMQLARGVKKLGYADFRLVTSPRVNYRTRGTLSLWLDGYLKSADDLLICESDATRNYLIESCGYDKEKLITIRNGVDIAGWPISQKGRRRMRAQLQLKDDEILVGAVGRLDEQKGHIYLLDAIAKLRASHPVHCVLIGTGPMQAKLEEKVRQLQIDGYVHFAGEQQDIPAWLSAFDIYALPSLWEGLPNALLEAMAVGLPVVATRVDGVPEVVANDVSGLLCDAKDANALFISLQDLVVDPELRTRLGQGAKTVVRENFKLRDMLEQYEAVYKGLLNNGEEDA
jgi:glycosyltransferase involved in cell wall biosynthesis